MIEVVRLQDLQQWMDTEQADAKQVLHHLGIHLALDMEAVVAVVGPLAAPEIPVLLVLVVAAAVVS